MKGVLYVNGQVFAECETTLDADGFAAAVEEAMKEVLDIILIGGYEAPRISTSVGLMHEPKALRLEIPVKGWAAIAPRQQFGRTGKGERKRNRKHRWG